MPCSTWTSRPTPNVLEPQISTDWLVLIIKKLQVKLHLSGFPNVDFHQFGDSDERLFNFCLLDLQNSVHSGSFKGSNIRKGNLRFKKMNYFGVNISVFAAKMFLKRAENDQNSSFTTKIIVRIDRKRRIYSN